jgi:hypothetical protein
MNRYCSSFSRDSTRQTPHRRRNERAWTCVTGMICIAVVGSIWAIIRPTTCASCDAAETIVGGRYLAIIGGVTYCLLLASALGFGPRLWIFVVLLALSGVHVALSAIMIRSFGLCLACLTTATAIWAATGCAISQFPQRLAFRLAIIPVTALLVTITVNFFSAASAERLAARTEKAMAVYIANEAWPRVGAKMLVFSRPGCPFCEKLVRDILPIFLSSHRGELVVQYRLAPDEIAVPTIVFLGKRPIAATGMQSVTGLDKMLKKCL